MNDLSEGFAKWEAGDWAGARQIFERALEDGEQSARVHSGLGHVCWSEGRFTEALGAFQTAARLEPYNASHWSNIGLSLRDLKQPRQAIHAFQVAVMLAPDYAAAYNEWGNVLQDAQLYEEALALYERSLSLDDSRPVVHHNKGVCHNRLGAPFLAETSFRAALRINPDYHHSLEEVGLLMIERNRPQEAIRFLTQAGTQRAQQALAQIQGGSHV